MSHRSHRGRSAVAAVVLLLLVSAPVAAFAASRLAVRATATVAPSATISPHSGLLDFVGDGQFVTVKWAGFAKGTSAYMRECTRGATDITSQCSQGGVFSTCGLSCPGASFLGTTAKDGTGQGLGQVAIGIINATEALDPIPGRSFTCDFQNDCSLFVQQDPFDLTTAIEIPITFATPADSCPEGGAFTTGSGGSAAFRMVLGWATQICTPPTNVGLQYTLRPAQGALDDYVAGFADYAVSPQAMDHDQQAALKAAGRTVAYAPVSLSALVFAYRIVDQVTGSRVTNLVLTPDILAKIFTGQIVQWNDPAIQKLNPTVHFPTFVAAITRGDANEESLTMTRFLWANAREAWIQGGLHQGITPNPLGVGPTNLIPSFGQVYLITGPTAEARNVAVGGSEFGSTSTYGIIGYVDSSWAGQYDLPTVKIRFDDGTTVAATPATITAALAHMTDCGSGLLSPDVTIHDSHVWPMPTVSYMAVPHNASSSDTPPTAEMATTLASLIRYGVGKGQEDVPTGYVPLPGALKTQARAVADTIMKGPKEPDADPCPPPPPPACTACPSPTPSPSTTPPTTPPPTTPPPTTTPPTTPPPSPTDVAVVVAAQPPPMTLAAARASAILPMMVLFGLLSVLVSPVLLFGDRVGSRLAPVVGRVRRLSPMRFIRRTRSKRGGP